MNLEKRVTEGNFYCIRSIDYDFTERNLIIEFIKPPEEFSPITRILTFSKVESFSDKPNWDEDAEENAEGEITDSLIGLDEHSEPDKMMYVVHTEEREMIFYTTEKPQIKDVRSKR